MHDGVSTIQRDQPVVALGHIAPHATHARRDVRPGSVRVNARYQAVQDGDGVSTPEQGVNHVGANEAGAAGYEDVHGQAVTTRSGRLAVDVEHDAGTAGIEGDRKFAQRCERSAHVVLPGRRHAEDEESTAARAGDFSAQGASGAGPRVHFVDGGVRNALGKGLLVAPGGVEQSAEFAQPATD